MKTILSYCSLLLALYGCQTLPTAPLGVEDSHPQAIRLMLIAMDAPTIAAHTFRAHLPKQEQVKPEVAQYYQCTTAQVDEALLLDVMVPIWQQYYTEAEAHQMIELFHSDVGTKMKLVMQRGAGLTQQTPQFSTQERQYILQYAHLLHIPTMQLINREMGLKAQELGADLGRRCLKHLQTPPPQLTYGDMV